MSAYARADNLDNCEHSDLPRWLCPHCPDFGRYLPQPAPPTLPDRRRVAGHWSIRWDGRGTYSRRWVGLTHELGKAKPVLVVCDHESDQPLCWVCVNDLARILEDIPALLVDLDMAFARTVRFVEHGQLPGQVDQADESPLPYSERAVKAKARLVDQLAAVADALRLPAVSATRHAYMIKKELPRLARFPAAREYASRISRAVDAAHRTIDKPASPWYYGPCPACKRDLYAERLDDDDPAATVVCPWPECGYAAPLIDHRRAQLDAGEDRELTVTELVGAISSGGIDVTRAQINNWIAREGLARRKDNRPRFVDGELKSHEVYVYRLGDVRRLAVEKAAQG